MMALQCLGEIFGISDLAENAKLKVQTNDGWVWDAVVTIRDHSFGLEWKRSGSLSHVAVATHQLKNLRSSLSNKVTPILAVPYMGKGAQELCEQAQLCWLDLSRNGRIVTASIFYQNLGNPNRFSQRGRPESAFGPRGSRIARRLLMNPSKAVRQRDLAKGTGLDEGHVSRVVGKLLEIGLVERGEDGMRVVDVDALLNAWRGDYRFDRHHAEELRHSRTYPSRQGRSSDPIPRGNLVQDWGSLCCHWPPCCMAVDTLHPIPPGHRVYLNASVAGS